MNKSLIIVKVPGATKEQYEQLRKVVDWEGNPPPGLLLHIVGFTKDGAVASDVWEDPKQFENFADSRLEPGFKQIGLRSKPEVEVVPFHTMFKSK